LEFIEPEEYSRQLEELERKNREGFKFRTYHGLGIATVLCLVTAFHYNGGKYQEASDNFLLFAVFGSGANYVEFKKTHRYRALKIKNILSAYGAVALLLIGFAVITGPRD